MSESIPYPVPAGAGQGGIVLMLAALLLDRLVGDPAGIPHPVALLGRCSGRLERAVRPRLRSAAGERAAGAVLALLLVLGASGVTWALVAGLGRIHPWLGWLAAAWLAATTVASKGLEQAALAVEGPLRAGDLAEARRRVAPIVGRDTDELDEAGVVRATVETVAENTVDAVVAPLLFTALGGAPMAMAYRCINTLDSLWGYRDLRYRSFGWGAARLDDLANWLPARVTGALLPLAAWALKADGRGAWRAIRRDAHRHPSPNAGIPEAGMAGALGIRLGGWNRYRGEWEFRAFLGGAGRVPKTADIRRALRLMHGVTACLLILLGSLAVLVRVAAPWLA